MFFKPKTKILFFFSKFFTSPKSRRAVFFLLLAVFILGFSINIPHAKAWTPTAEDYKKLEPYGTKAEVDQMLAEYPKTQNWYTLATYFPEYASASSSNAIAASINNSSVSSMASGLKQAALTVVIGVLSIICYFLKELVRYAAMALDLTLNPALYSFTSNDMIVQGWTMVRDVCNLFFLLVLLFIALCTILQIPKYHAKKTLLTLIIMALLINFSKPIAIFIFDGSQLLMNLFLNQMGKTGSGQETSDVVMKASAIAKIVYQTLPDNTGTELIAIQYLFAVVFLFMLAVAFFVTALMLIIRIVVIMMLIIVSPFAFFAAIVPDFSKMSSQWWSSLFEYSYYGPAAAFFLLLATKLEGALPNIKNTTNVKTLDATVYNIIHYLVVLVFLYASIIMAKKFGGGAGAAVVGNANRVMKWAGGMSKGGGMWGAGARAIGNTGMYKGVKGGIAKQPGWRMFTKEGREARSKESQAKWERKVAPFSMAAARKEADERKNDDQSKVNSGIKKGNAADILIASKRGTLSDEQIASANVLKTISGNKELRKEVLGNLKDKGNTHLAAYLRHKTRDMEDVDKATGEDPRTWSLEQFGKKEIDDNKKLADMNWEKVMDPKFKDNLTVNFKASLVNRMENIAETDPRRFLNIISNLDGARLQKVTNDNDFKKIIEKAKDTARGGRREQNNQQNQGRTASPSDVPWN